MSETTAELTPETYTPHAYWDGRYFVARCPFCDHTDQSDRKVDTLQYAESHLVTHRIERAQADYVARWQAEHPMAVLDDGWRCPLCNEIVQVRPVDADWRDHDIKLHQDGHLSDWAAYVAAGQGAERESEDD